MAFTHLHVHTAYSLLDGSCKIPELVNRAKELGFKHLAITDHGVMYGVIEFYKACRKAGIHPILGSEVYVAPGSRLDRELGADDERYYHLILLAENDEGYRNLMKIVSQGFKDGFYYRPRVDKETLRKYHNGIIATSACLAGEVQNALKKGRYEAAKTAALEYADIFGPDHFYLELQDHGYEEQKIANQGLMRLHDETGLPLIATNDVHYIHAEDWEAHDILLCIQTQKKVTDEDRLRYTGGQFYLKSEAEMRALFPYAEEALDNTEMIAERCNVEIEFGHTKLPRFDVPAGYTSDSYLTELCRTGFAKRYPDADEALKKQLEYELDVIRRMGYVDYFLIVWDFIRYARSKGIPVGPGRGSAAGSLVSYSLGITNIDPVRFNLLFERFLNPERVTMPDIDVDFCYERRQEVIDYVVEKYGAECVTQIVTFGTLKAKGVIRDVGRVMDKPYAFCDRLAKMVPVVAPGTLKEQHLTELQYAMKNSPEMKAAYESDPEAAKLLDMSLKLEGLPRHSSMHAAGVVIASRPMDEYVPLSRSASDAPLTTEFEMTTIEELGLLKMDFLGLRTLTVLHDAVENVREARGIEIDLDHLDWDDKNVYRYIGTGECDGIFQLESAGMRSFMKRLQPDSLEDIVAGISLYRPGPMQFIDRYIAGKRDPKNVTYLCPELKPILEPTYGCIVYQEQVMQIVQRLGGYTLGRADLVRRAMSKKKLDVMNAERQNFVYGNEAEGVEGCLKKGISPEISNQIFDQMIAFAEYAFNKSHAAAYAVVAYETAYLICYYPAEYLAALMTSFMENTEKVSEYIYTCRKMKIGLLPPDINEGKSAFSVRDGKIRYGLSAIKGIGKGVVDEIVRERTANGPYRDLRDFMTRLSTKEVNKKTLESFIKAGAFDSFGHTRRQEMSHYPILLDAVEKTRKDSLSGQFSLFDLAGMKADNSEKIADRYPNVGEYEKEQLLAFEKEVLGIYLSGHPLESYVDLLNRNVTRSSLDFKADEDTGEAEAEDGERAVIGGIITAKTVRSTKTNETMAVLTVEDMVGTLEVLAFPKTYERYRDMMETETSAFFLGRVSTGSDAEGKLILEKIMPFSAVPKELWLQFDDLASYEAKFPLLSEGLHSFDGKDTLVVYLKDSKKYRKMGFQYAVDIAEGAADYAASVLGQENVATRYGKISW